MEQREAAIRRWFDMWLTKRDTGIRELFAPDAVHIESWGPEYHGADKIAWWFTEWNPYIKLYERMKYGKAAGYTAHAGIAKATANGTKFLILHSTDDKTISPVSYTHLDWRLCKC